MEDPKTLLIRGVYQPNVKLITLDELEKRASMNE